MSRFIEAELRRFKDELTVKFYTEEPFQLTAADHEAVLQSKEMILRKRKYKHCQYACCALYESGVYKCGTHLYTRRMHEFSICAEHRPIERAHFKNQGEEHDNIVTIATFHGGHDKTGLYTREPYLVSPCEKCLRNLLQVSPDALVVVDLDSNGRLAKIPLEAVEFFRHPMNHNGE